VSAPVAAGAVDPPRSLLRRDNFATFDFAVGRHSR
jgi:hypothetical protein